MKSRVAQTARQCVLKPMELQRIFDLVRNLTWHRNHEAGAWGPEHGAIVVVPSERKLRKFASDDCMCGTFIGEMNWFKYSPPEPGPDGLAKLVEHARRTEDASLAVLYVLDSHECLAGMVPRDPKRMFPSDQDREATRRQFEMCPAVANPSKKDMASAYFCLCAGCQKPLGKEKRYMCNRCRTVYFCSDECRIGHWPEHKGMCFDISKS